MTKYKSETFRKGEPEDHRLAATWLREALQSRIPKVWTFRVVKDFPFKFPKEYVEKNKLPHDKHKADLVVIDPDPDGCEECGDFKKLVAVIEVTGKTAFHVVFPDGTEIKGTPTKHDKTQQKINDGMFFAYIQTVYPDALFYEIEKGDCFDSFHVTKTFDSLFKRLEELTGVDIDL